MGGDYPLMVDTTLAELRVRQGRLLDAERLLAGGGEQPGRLRALALLRMAGGVRERQSPSWSGLGAPRPIIPYAPHSCWPRWSTRGSPAWTCGVRRPS